MSVALTPQEAGAMVPVSLSHQLAASIKTWWAAAKPLTVTDAASAEAADTLVGEARALIATLDTTIKPAKQRLDELKAGVLAREKAYKGPITDHAMRLKAEIAAYLKKRSDDAAKAASDARTQREAEAAALLAAAVVVRTCKVCHEPVDEKGCFCPSGTPTLQAPRAFGGDEPKPLPDIITTSTWPTRVAKAVQGGGMLAAIPRPALIPKPEAAPVLQNTTERKSWKFEVTSVDALPKEFQIVTVTANEDMIASVVRGMEGKTSIPGVRVWEHTEMVAARKRA